MSRHYPDDTPDDPDLVRTLKRIRYDLTDLQVKVSEALRQAAAAQLPTPARHVCPQPLCKLEFRSATKLAEHVYVSHNGPVPDHYQRAEHLADA